MAIFIHNKIVIIRWRLCASRARILLETPDCAFFFSEFIEIEVFYESYFFDKGSIDHARRIRKNTSTNMIRILKRK